MRSATVANAIRENVARYDHRGRSALTTPKNNYDLKVPYEPSDEAVKAFLLGLGEYMTPISAKSIEWLAEQVKRTLQEAYAIDFGHATLDKEISR